MGLPIDGTWTDRCCFATTQEAYEDAFVDLSHIKHHYYRSYGTINPTGVVPVGPELDFDRPHGRNPKGGATWRSETTCRP